MILRINDKSGGQETIQLDPGRSYVLGRSSSKTDVRLQHEVVSQTHAQIRREGETWLIEDLKSTNGTYIDNRRLERGETAPLLPGSRVKVGPYLLELVVPGESRDKVVLPDLPASGGTVMLAAPEVIANTGAGPAEVSTAAQLETLRRRFAVVEKATLELSAHETMDVLLPKVLDLVFEAVRPERAALLRRDTDGELVRRAFRGTDEHEWFLSRTVANVVLDDQMCVRVGDTRQDELLKEGKSIIFQGIRSVMAVPLWDNKKVIGLVYADSREATTSFTDEDLRVLTMLANVAAIQIENAVLFEEQLEKQRLEREARGAAEIQQRLLPQHPPVVEGYRFVGHNTPCHEVGGDYYDCLDVADQRHAIVLADVAGHGMGAAILMATVEATYHARAKMSESLEGLIAHLNGALCYRTPMNRFVTMFCMDLDRANHRVRWVNAGHAPPPVLITADGELRRLGASGPPLGMLDDVRYTIESLDLGPGDLIFACSDGLTDIENPEGDAYGHERLERLLVSLAGKSAEEMREVVEKEVGDHAQDAHQPDDLTFILLQRES